MEDFLVNVQWPIKRSPYISSTKTLRLLCEGRYTSDYVEVLQQCSTWMEFSIRDLLQNERQEHYPLIINNVSYYVLCEVLCLINTGDVDIYAKKYLKHFATALKKLGIHQPEVPNEDTFVVLRASIFAVPNTYVDDLVICCEGQKLSANRCVLMVRSGFFDAVLQNVPENRVVNVHGVRFQQLEQVVSFLYCRDLVLRTWTKHGKSEFEQFCSLIETFKIRNQELPQVFHEPLGSSTTQEGGSSEEPTRPTRSRRMRRLKQWFAVVADRINRLTVRRRGDRPRSLIGPSSGDTSRVFHEPLGLSTTPEGGSSEEPTRPTRSRGERRLRQWFAVVADKFNRLTVRRREDRPGSLIDPSSGDTSRVSRSFQSKETDLQTPKKSSKKGSSFRKLRKSFRKKGKFPSEKDELFELKDFSRTKSGQSSEGGFSSDISSSAPEKAGPSRKSAMPSPKKAGRSPKEPGGSPKGPRRFPKGPGRSPKGTAHSAEEAGPSGTQAGFFRRVLQSFFKKPTPPTSPEDDETYETVFV